MGAGTLRDLLDDLRRMSEDWLRERFDVDFVSFCFRFAKLEFDGVEGRERDGERDFDLSPSGLGVPRLSSDADGRGEGAEMVRRRGEIFGVRLFPAVAPCMSEGTCRSEVPFARSCSEL